MEYSTNEKPKLKNVTFWYKKALDNILIFYKTLYVKTTKLSEPYRTFT